MVTPVQASFVALLVIHFALFAWALRNIIKSEITGFEKGSWALLCLVLPILGTGLYAAYAKKYLLKMELAHIVLAVIVLGFLFSFRLWGLDVFSVSAGFFNWLYMSGLAVVALGGHILTQKAMARHFYAISRFKLWGLGVVISIVLIFLTKGWFIWASVGCAAVSAKYFIRPGKKVAGLSPYETAKIVATGTFASIGLAVLGKLLIPYFGTIAEQFMNMNLWIAVFSVIPLFLIRVFGALHIAKWFSPWKKKRALKPGKPWVYGKPSWSILEGTLKRVGKMYLSEGEIVFFGSKALWIFTFVFVIMSAALLIWLGALLSILIAGVLATIMFLIWHQKFEPKTFRNKGSA
jgi:hypothetical protein